MGLNWSRPDPGSRVGIDEKVRLLDDREEEAGRLEERREARRLHRAELRRSLIFLLVIRGVFAAAAAPLVVSFVWMFFATRFVPESLEPVIGYCAGLCVIAGPVFLLIAFAAHSGVRYHRGLLEIA